MLMPKTAQSQEEPRPIVIIELGWTWWIPARLLIRQGDKQVEIFLPNWAAEALQRRLGNVGPYH